MLSFPPHCTQSAPLQDYFFSRRRLGIGTAALAGALAAGGTSFGTLASPVDTGLHFPAKAKRVISLFMSGGPSQMDLFDYKPELNKRNGQQLPDSVRQGQRLTGMSANQASLPLAGSAFRFEQVGQAGMWMSDLLPHTKTVADKLCLIQSVFTEAINHDPAITFMQTGAQIAGRPSLGAWLSYGLGSMNANLPEFCVLVTKNKGGQPLYSRLWGSGFLPSVHQGVQFRSGNDPVLYLNDPEGVPRQGRVSLLKHLKKLHEHALAEQPDAAIRSRIAEAEMAFRMQSAIPEVADLSEETEATLQMYGDDVNQPGTFAANCLLARRLAERDVRFIQLFHKGWDQHGGLPGGIRNQCRETDQPAAALLKDLDDRGMLEDTLVIWCGEFGRTAYSQGKLTPNNYGRDHHPRCYTVWMAGGGVQGGRTIGSTDDFSYNIAARPIHVHDLNASLLHLLGIDHKRLTFRYQGRQFRLTDVEGELVPEIWS